MSQALSEPRTASGSATAAYAQGKEVLLEVTDLKKHFPIKSGLVIQREVAAVKAVDGVSLAVRAGVSAVLAAVRERGGPKRDGPAQEG